MPEQTAAEVDAMMAALAAPAPTPSSAGQQSGGSDGGSGDGGGGDGGDGGGDGEGSDYGTDIASDGHGGGSGGGGVSGERRRGRRGGRGGKGGGGGKGRGGKGGRRRRRRRRAIGGNATVPDWPRGRLFAYAPLDGVVATAEGTLPAPDAAVVAAATPVVSTQPTQPQRAGGGGGGGGGRAPQTADIYTGKCAAAASGRGRLMTAAECADYAAAEGRPFIGRGTEATEYPGCVRWESGHVEFNEHSDEGEGCNLGRKGRCVCAVKA